MDLEVTPQVDDEVVQALREVLQPAREPERSAWWRAAVDEAVERDEDYAFSPRSTRGATRA
jgi:hypothetical protein